jgi:stage II sporulation protein D
MATASAGGSGGRGAVHQRVPNVMLPDIDRRTRVNSSDVDVRVKGSEAVILGRGFGHGVGMCQYCAKGFSERGEKWQTMVLRFYPGASIEKAY